MMLMLMMMMMMMMLVMMNTARRLRLVLSQRICAGPGHAGVECLWPSLGGSYAGERPSAATVANGGAFGTRTLKKPMQVREADRKGCSGPI